jgi:hypothetical protein
LGNRAHGKHFQEPILTRRGIGSGGCAGGDSVCTGFTGGLFRAAFADVLLNTARLGLLPVCCAYTAVFLPPIGLAQTGSQSMTSQMLFRNSAFLLLSVFVFLLVVYTMEKTGVPRSYAVGLSAVFGLAFWLVPVMRGATTSDSLFLLANSGNGVVVSSLAIMVSAMLPVVLADGGVLFFANPSFLVMLGLAIVTGICLSGLLISRKMQEGNAADLCEQLLADHTSPLAVRCMAVVIGFSGIGLMTCGLAAGSLVAGWFFNIGPMSAMIVFGAIVVLAGNIGGQHSSTRLAAVAGILLILAINLPLLGQSMTQSDFLLGHFSFGNYALAPTWDLEDQLRSLAIPEIAVRLGDVSTINAWGAELQIAAAFFVALGLVVSPTLTQQYATSSTPETASQAAGRAILLAGLTAVSLVAFLAFAKLGVYQSILGTSLSEARNSASFLYNWGDHDIPLVLLCDQAINSKNALLAACGGDADYIVNLEDIELNRHLLTIAAPEFSAMPFAFTAFLAISVLLTICSFTTMTALSTTSNLVTAYYTTLPGKVASGRIFVMRFLLLALVILGGLYLLNSQIDPLKITVFSLSIITASLLPAVIASFHFNIHSSVVLGWSVAAGFAATILYYVLAKIGVDIVADSGDELALPFPGIDAVPPELGALFGLPVGVVVLLVAQLIVRIYHEPGAETDAAGDSPAD